MKNHSVLSPSSAARRVACPGSRALEELFSVDDSVAPSSLEGQAAHWVAEQFLKITQLELPEVGAITPCNQVVTQEMLDGAELYLNDIVCNTPQNIKEAYFRNELVVEETINISSIHPECFGTPDAWIYDSGHLFIWDYKFGHSYVDVYENWQLIEYAAGIFEKLGINLRNAHSVKVVFRIIQPRCFHREGQIREWIIQADALYLYFVKLLEAEHLSMTPQALCNPSPACTFCKARHACSALQETALTIADSSKNSFAHNLDNNALGNELRYLKQAAGLLNARLTGLEEQATALLKKGERIPHFRLEETKGRLQWSKPAEEILMLGELMGIDLKKPVDIITPTQAKNLGVSETLIHKYAASLSGALKLVLEETKTSAKIFKKS